MLIKPEFRPKAIRSFVIRSGRMTDGQKAAFEKHWQIYGLELKQGLISQESVFGRSGELNIEIGFGMGDSLLEMCLENPDANFIGIEVHPPGVGRIMNRAAKEGITNLRVYMADARDVLAECVSDQSVDRIQVYFPDPWHKKKHHKRRLIQKEFIAVLQPKLKTGGILHLATDWQNYAEHMREVMESQPQFVNLAGEEQYSPRPDWRPETKFERRGHRLGHGVWDLIYKLTP
jgi:tRNA (guanine-N7-)-methyltransferase